MVVVVVNKNDIARDLECLPCVIRESIKLH